MVDSSFFVKMKYLSKKIYHVKIAKETIISINKNKLHTNCEVINVSTQNFMGLLTVKSNQWGN